MTSRNGSSVGGTGDVINTRVCSVLDVGPYCVFVLIQANY
jgi:hypothetical protein